jgi:hypothetical protein
MRIQLPPKIFAMSATHQLGAEDGEVSYSVEILDVLESAGLIVGHLGRIQK